MAKLPKKVAVAENAEQTSLRDFVSTAAHKPTSGSNVTRVNLSLTEDDMDVSADLQNSLSLSRVEIFRAGLVALKLLSAEERMEIAGKVRRSSPKAGRPTVKR
jgi:hypothetical protein